MRVLCYCSMTSCTDLAEGRCVGGPQRRNIKATAPNWSNWKLKPSSVFRLRIKIESPYTSRFDWDEWLMLKDASVTDWQAGEKHCSRMIGFFSLMFLSDLLVMAGYIFKTRPSVDSCNDPKHFICHFWQLPVKRKILLRPKLRAEFSHLPVRRGVINSHLSHALRLM